VNKLTNTLIVIRSFQVYDAQMNWHMDALDWTEDVVDGSLPLETMNEVDGGALGCYRISVRF
jgi:hypothetical protein